CTVVLYNVRKNRQTHVLNACRKSVTCVAFSPDGRYLATGECGHAPAVRVWDLQDPTASGAVQIAEFIGHTHGVSCVFKEPVPLMGRSAILGEQKDNEFCDVVCGRGASGDSTYCITRGGLLCEFNSRRLLDKWVELRTTSANCMAIGSNYIFVGCAEGIVRCFAPDTLQYITTLPRTHYLGVDVALGTNIRTIVITDNRRPFRKEMFLRLPGNWQAIFTLDVFTDVALNYRNDDVAFSYCSDDELNKVFYIDPELKFLKDVDLTATNDKDKSKSYDDKTGVSGTLLHTLEAHDAEVLCLEYSARPRLLASASRDRLIHVFQVDRGYQIMQTLDEHSSSITAVRFLSSGAGLQMVSCGADKTILFRQLRHVALDNSGIYLATSSTDKILSVFTPDCQHLISASGDGCIFVWRVPHDMVVTMRARLAQQAIRQGKKVSTASNGMSGLDSESDSHFGSPPRELPFEENKFGTPVVPDYTYVWDSGSGEKRGDSDGSKDSSLDSGTDTRYIEKRKDQTGIKQVSFIYMEFMVNAMDADELRESMRRSKRWTGETRLELPPPHAKLTGTPQDSDDDEVLCAFSNTSLSSQHLSRGPAAAARSGPAPSPAPRTPVKALDPEAARRREELNRRIHETRRQLETVAFRSNLKSSQSTTDLSYIPEKDSTRRNRPVSMAIPSNSKPYGKLLNFVIKLVYNVVPYVPPHANIPTTHNDKKNPHFTPYDSKPLVFKEQLPQKPLAFTIDMSKPVQSKVFNRLFPEKEPKPRNFTLNLTKNDEKPAVPKTAKPARSIFKNYKSCPVSPVSEECKWADKANQKNQKSDTNSLDPKKRNSLSFFVGFDNKNLKDNGKSIVDTIKSDTEKMIAEITKKYGDLDEYDVARGQDDLDLKPTKEKDDGNFSSDSLEDCSLSQDASCKNKLYSKKVCKKHTKTQPRRAVSNYEIYGSEKPVVPAKPAYITNQKSSTLPRNMPSNLDDIVEDSLKYNSNMYRCQSVLTKRCITRSNESVLSDNSNCSSISNEIFLKYGNEVAFQQAKFDGSRYNLNDMQNCSYENIPDTEYLENHRHSSASFFLNQKKYMKNSCSQESVLSDDFLDNENQLCRTNCNSLESVLSDDSECTKSAPLEMLFEGAKPIKQQKNTSIPRNSKSCYEFDNTSKSYGSSPNNAYFGYMYNNYLGEAASPNYREPNKPTPVVSNPKPPAAKVYGFDVPVDGHKTVTRSKSLYDSASKQPPPAKNIAYYFDGNNIQQYHKEKKLCDEIPRLNKSDHMSNTKSLQPKFADKYKSEMEGCETKTMVKSKSCSFEVVLEPASKPNPLKNLMEKRNSHVQKNLEKFEEQIRKNTQTKVSKNQLNKEKSSGKYNNATKSLERGSGQKNNNTKITMEFVPHKPPKPIKRTSSVKMNNRLKAGIEKSGLTSSISSQYKAKLDGLHNKNYLGNKKPEDANSNIEADSTEKHFDVFVKEKDVNENKSEIQMDSLEVYAMQRMERLKQVSMDSLDIDPNDFAKDSLDYYAEQDNKLFAKTSKDQLNLKLARNDLSKPSHSRQSDTKENISPEISEEIKKYKNIERKIEIINKLVEMEEKRILQEKILKEWRMRPLKANINDGKGVVKLLSRKFEKLATKQSSTVHNFASLTLEEADTDTDTASENKEIKRNLSLPDILDSDQIGGLVTVGRDITNEAGNTGPTEDVKLNNAFQPEIGNPPRSLKQRVYNEMVIPKTDVHLDSENYESSTTSSSCTNSPKRLSFYGFSRPKTPFRKIIRGPTPRLCMENRLFPHKIRPVLYGSPRGSCLAKKVPVQNPVLPSKFSPNQVTVSPANRSHLSASDREEEGSGMRRAISLSDLAAKPMPAPRTTQGASGDGFLALKQG
ncbi:hypothetical protein HF086_014629, partial [Spodoptera exigua]